jgi:hypothetical protein
MLYNAAVFVAVVASANGFTMNKAPQRMAALKMSEDPWFPNTVTKNTVSIGALE